MDREIRLFFLKMVFILLLVGCKENNVEKFSGSERPPNILILFPDQMRGSALGCMGNAQVLTPNLDRLAANGTLLRNTYSNTPVCSPARAVLMTGKYAHANGMVTNDLRLSASEITIAEIFGQYGYSTGFVGKWHLDGGPKLPGYVPPERRQGFQYWAANICDHNHYDSQYFKGNDSIPIPIDRFEPEIWVDESIEFIESLDKDSPFFLMTAMGPPHNPYKAPEAFRNLYGDTTSIQMPPNWMEGIKNGSKEDLLQYYSMISAVDHQIGRLIGALEKKDRIENTIILFLSDHGDMLGSHASIYKRQPWEESASVPGIISWPMGLPKGKVSDALFTTVDVLPTLLELASLQIPGNIQGNSIKSALFDKAKGPDLAYLQILGPCEWQGVKSGWRGIRTSRYKYARYEHEPWILYDLMEDPYEMNNLVNSPSFAKVQSQMDSLLLNKMFEIGDSWEMNWDYPFADNWELQKYRAFESIETFFQWKETMEAGSSYK